MDQTWCPVCPVAVKGELLRCNEATAEQGLSLTIQDWEELQAGRRAALADTGRVEFGLGIVTDLAKEIPCDIDYQLALPVPERMQGVRYVKEYLRRLSVENHFLRRYTWADLVPVLERYHPWYQEEVCNLFLPVAVNALGKALLEAAPVPLTMTEEEREALAQRFRDQTKETVFAQLAAAARSVAGQEENTAYLTACAEDLAGRLFALEGGGTVWL